MMTSSPRSGTSVTLAEAPKDEVALRAPLGVAAGSIDSICSVGSVGSVGAVGTVAAVRAGRTWVASAADQDGGAEEKVLCHAAHTRNLT